MFSISISITINTTQDNRCFTVPFYAADFGSLSNTILALEIGERKQFLPTTGAVQYLLHDERCSLDGAFSPEARASIPDDTQLLFELIYGAELAAKLETPDNMYSGEPLTDRSPEIFFPLLADAEGEVADVPGVGGRDGLRHAEDTADLLFLNSITHLHESSVAWLVTERMVRKAVLGFVSGQIPLAGKLAIPPTRFRLYAMLFPTIKLLLEQEDALVVRLLMGRDPETGWWSLPFVNDVEDDVMGEQNTRIAWTELVDRGGERLEELVHHASVTNKDRLTKLARKYEELSRHAENENSRLFGTLPDVPVLGVGAALYLENDQIPAGYPYVNAEAVEMNDGTVGGTGSVLLMLPTNRIGPRDEDQKATAG